MLVHRFLELLLPVYLPVQQYRNLLPEFSMRQHSPKHNRIFCRSKCRSVWVVFEPWESQWPDVDVSLKAAGIKDLRFHDLRHTAATRMGDAGADAFTLAPIFGWSDIRMAMRYTHAMEDAKRRAVESIAQNQSLRDYSVINERLEMGQLPVSH